MFIMRTSDVSWTPRKSLGFSTPVSGRSKPSLSTSACMSGCMNQKAASKQFAGSCERAVQTEVLYLIKSELLQG